MKDVSRRGFLKGSAIGAAAVVLGWRPSLPVAPPVAVAAVPATIPGVVKLASIIPVSNEMLEDAVGMEAFIRERLTESLAKMEEDLILHGCLDERFDSAPDHDDGWMRNETAYRLTRTWEVEATPEQAAQWAAL